jgi:hypothetical protein
MVSKMSKKGSSNRLVSPSNLDATSTASGLKRRDSQLSNLSKRDPKLHENNQQDITPLKNIPLAPGDDPNVIKDCKNEFKNNKIITFKDPKRNLAQSKKMYMDETGRRIL